jgi:hypothetical protein
MSRLSDLASGRREYLQTAWPANVQLGRPEPIPLKLQALSDEQFQEAIAAAHERLRTLKIPHEGISGADHLEGEVSLQILARACRDNDNPATTSFAIDADDLRRNSSPWEQSEIGDQWKAFQERRNPIFELRPEEKERIVDALKKKDATSLRGFGVDSLVSFMLTSGSPRST